MIVDTTTSWIAIKEIISSVGVLVAIIVSIVGLIKASRQKEADQIENIKENINDLKDKFNEHVLNDEHAITELQTKVEYLTDNVSTKLDAIIRELDKD